MSSLRAFAALLAWSLCFCAGGCGAGIIAGVVAGSDGGNSGAPPSLTLLQTQIPLLPPANASPQRTVVITNAQIPASARLDVQIAVGDVVVPQGNPSIQPRQGSSTLVSFDLDTALFVTTFGTDE